MSAVNLRHGEALDVLRTLPDASVDAVVCDPPYGLADIRPADVAEAVTAWCGGDREHIPARLRRGFMGRDWDRFVPPPAVWDECLRVLRPGGHLVAFAGSRTYDLMGLSIRLAGFEIRDGLQWLYSTGFPKSLDVGKAIDKAGGGSPVEQGRVLREARERAGMSPQDVATAVGCSVTSVRDWEDGRSRAVGEQREVCTPSPAYRRKLADLLDYTEDERVVVGVGRKAGPLHSYGHGKVLYGEATTPAAERWQGWGTALKPAHEPIVLARKPLAGTVAANVLAHGTGALNIDGCRVPTSDTWSATRRSALGIMNDDGWQPKVTQAETHDAGRWPSNVLLTHPDTCADQCAPGCPVAELDAQSGTLTSGANPTRRGADKGRQVLGEFAGQDECAAPRGTDTGGASRFYPTFRYQAKAPQRERPKVDGKGHPTVKPVALMEWVVRLVTPPGGRIVDPFAGSGTTGEAAQRVGVDALLIERDEHSVRLCEVRCGVEHTAAPTVDVEPAPVELAAAPVAAVALVDAVEFVLAAPADPVLDAIAAARSDAELTAAWELHADAWSPAHTDAVRLRLAELGDPAA